IVLPVTHVLDEIEVLSDAGALTDGVSGLCAVIDSRGIDGSGAIGGQGSKIGTKGLDEIGIVGVGGCTAKMLDIEGDAVEMQGVDDTGFHEGGELRISKAGAIPCGEGCGGIPRGGIVDVHQDFNATGLQGTYIGNNGSIGMIVWVDGEDIAAAAAIMSRVGHFPGGTLE